jgi:threonine dehydrogenase-like Zn-dependent dehydrogenase
MLAMTYRGPNRVRIDQKSVPHVEHPGDAIIRVTRAAICGSDVHLYHGFIPDTRVGATFGHEFTGVVEEVGDEVQNLKRGDRVVVPFNIACGSCFFCSRSLTGCCENSNPSSEIASGVFGYSHSTGGFDGGQAEYVRVPFADVGPFKIPEGMTDEEILFVSDIFPTGYQAAEMGEIKPGETVVVFGCGPVGLFAQKSAWLMGAGRVIAVDHLDYRLEFAKNYAQVETVNFSQVDDIVLHLKKMTEGRGPDVCIDAVGLEADGSFFQTLTGVKLKAQAGAATATAWAIDAVRKGGNISIVGVYGPPWNLLPIGTAMNKNVTLRMGQCNVKRYMPRLIEHIQSGRVDAQGIITHRFPLEAVDEAYRIFSKKEDGCIKAILIPPKAA